ncbi:MAG: MgtC/SapB family protein [Anaerolineae bacterium]|nr:MgtC/SapB family protein [Anaerolineae bacterium]
MPWWEVIGRLLLSLLLGGVIGWDREVRGKPAGLRTIIIVSVSSTLYVVATQAAAARAGENLDVVRAMAGIAQGVSFLGAGAIIRSRAGVKWLTTAAALWAAAAIGFAVGVGMYLPAILGCALVFVTLHWLVPLEERFDKPESDKPGAER